MKSHLELTRSILDPSKKYRVVKVGGSLLGNERLDERLKAFQREHADHTNVYLVGGGRRVRRIERIFKSRGVEDRTCHELCLRAMLLNTQTLNLNLQWAIFRSIDQLNSSSNSPGFFDLTSIEFAYRDTSWNNRSDSLAALLACEIDAEELVLLKSIEPPAQRAGWVANGFVDPNFDDASKDIEHVRSVCLSTSS